MRDKQTVVIQFGKPLNVEELKAAFSVAPENQLYKAILQILKHYQDDSAIEAATFMREGNTLGMAGCNGAVDIINTLFLEFERRRKEATR